MGMPSIVFGHCGGLDQTTIIAHTIIVKLLWWYDVGFVRIVLKAGWAGTTDKQYLSSSTSTQRN